MTNWFRDVKRVPGDFPLKNNSIGSNSDNVHWAFMVGMIALAALAATQPILITRHGVPAKLAEWFILASLIATFCSGKSNLFRNMLPGVALCAGWVLGIIVMLANLVPKLALFCLGMALLHFLIFWAGLKLRIRKFRSEI